MFPPACEPLPKAVGRLLWATLGDHGLIEVILELQVELGLAGGIAGLPRFPFPGFVARHTGLEIWSVVS